MSAINRRRFLAYSGGLAAGAAFWPQGIPALATGAPRSAPPADIDPTGTITIIGTVPPRQFDPHVSASIVGDYPHIALVYDRLIEARKGPVLAPMIAESWEFSDDGMALELTLNPAAVFHDGTPIDADAVKANLDRAMTLPESTVAGYLSMVDAVEVVDAATVRLVTNRPAADLPSVLASLVGSVVNPAGFEDPDLATTPYGSGAFQLEELVINDRVSFTRFDDYWNPETAARAAGLTILGIPDDQAKLNAFRSGQGDVSFFKLGTYQDFADFAESEDEIDIVFYPYAATYQIFLNTDHEALGNQLVRQALNHAVDRDLINETLLYGMSPPTNQILQEVYPGHVPDLDERYPYDPDAARELLAEAGYADGFSFTIGVGAGLTPQTLFPPVIQAMLSEIGVSVEVVEGDLLDINPRWASGELDAYAQTRQLSADPGAGLRNNYLAPNGFPGTPPEGLVEAIEATLDPTVSEEERTELLVAANTMITEQALDLFLTATATTFAFNTAIVGVGEMGQSDFQGVYDARYLARRAG